MKQRSLETTVPTEKENEVKIKVLGVDPALSNLGLAIAEVDLDDPENYQVYDLILTQTQDGKVEKLVKGKDGKLKKKKVMPKGTSVGSDDVRRAKILSTAFMKAASQVDLVIAEVPIGSQSARAMASYGVSVALLGSCPVPLIKVSPSDAKLAGCNDTTATKQEMIDAAVSLFPDAPWVRGKTKRKGVYPIIGDNEHLADACFIIRAGLRTDEFIEYAEQLKNGQPISVCP